MKGTTTREIVATFKEMFDADVSPSQISKVTDAVMELVNEWPSRPLDKMYPIIDLDCIVFNIRQDKQITNKSVYFTLRVDMI